MSEQQQPHPGVTCPFCGINGTCGHPVKLPAIPPWISNVWFKSVPTDN